MLAVNTYFFSSDAAGLRLEFDMNYKCIEPFKNGSLKRIVVSLLQLIR